MIRPATYARPSPGRRWKPRSGAPPIMTAGAPSGTRRSRGCPRHRESRFWLVAGLLLPIWDRLPDESMRVRRLLADDGEHLIGRVLGPAEVGEFRAALGLDGGPRAHRRRGPRRDHGAGRVLPARQRLEASRAAASWGPTASRSRDRPTAIPTRSSAWAASPRSSPGAPACSRPTAPPSSASSSAGPSRSRRRPDRTPPASIRPPPHLAAGRRAGGSAQPQQGHIPWPRTRLPEEPVFALRAGLRLRGHATADKDRVPGHDGLRSNGPRCADARRCGAALRPASTPGSGSIARRGAGWLRRSMSAGCGDAPLH